MEDDIKLVNGLTVAPGWAVLCPNEADIGSSNSTRFIGSQLIQIAFECAPEAVFHYVRTAPIGCVEVVLHFRIDPMFNSPKRESNFYQDQVVQDLVAMINNVLPDGWEFYRKGDYYGFWRRSNGDHQSDGA